ncbi:hypothetical protein ACH4UV_08470 [Streptomyces sp. NPDC020802]|uniref:hypothetical protein n=1 Tax=Streptomyces sp. NPDC020802 TaxID=3365094 RepID=UPI00378FE8EC
MSDGRARTGAPEVVLAGGGTTARFDGQRLRIVRGTTTWTMPVRAVRAAESTPGGGVRIELSGDPGDGRAARHGLGAGVSIPSRNAHAARAFTEQLQRALSTTATAADGHALVLVHTRQRVPSPRVRRLAAIGAAVLAYAAVLGAVGWRGPEGAGIALAVTGWMGPAGAGLLFFCWVRLIRDLVALRRRGITVSGRGEGTVRGFGGNVFYFRRLGYRTVDGEEFTRVESRGSVGVGTLGVGPVDVTYDPLDPRTATGPLSFHHVAVTLFLVLMGLVVLLVWAGALLYALAG